MDQLPQLDVLLYAHDGRGLGHASRTIAIGLALRRLYPQLRILFLSGCKSSQQLIGSAPLDWIKLPSYETEVRQGKSQGIRGNSNFEDLHLGTLRARQIAEIATLYRPKVILADHSPQGKHRELLPALEATQESNTHWVLGLRAVIGQVSQVKSEFASSLYHRFYTSILWYGDSAVLGKEQLDSIENHYGASAIECGYVSRITELGEISSSIPRKEYAATVSVPWTGEKTLEFLHNLYSSLKMIGEKYGPWKFYLDAHHNQTNAICNQIGELPFCTVEKPGESYIYSLQKSHCALIYGGYNSIMDVLSVSLPSLVIQRDMQDSEQQQHLRALMQFSDELLHTLPEDTDAATLHQSLRTILESKPVMRQTISLEGAANAAHYLHSLITDS